MSNKPGSAINDMIAAAYRLHAEIVAAGDAIASEFKLSAARWQVLGAIELEGNVTVPDLARLIGITRQSVQRIVSELIDEDVLALADNPRHRRSRLVVMTIRGRDAYDAVMAAWAPQAAALEREVGLEASRMIARDMGALAKRFHNIADRSSRNAEHSNGMHSPNSMDDNNEP